MLLSLTITGLSILCIAGIAWVFSKKTGKTICFVCAGVAGTWLIFAIARLNGYATDSLMTGILMGGSVVGLMYQIERNAFRGYIPPILKIFFVITGFISVYTFLQYFWSAFFIAAGSLILIGHSMHRGTYIFSNSSKENEKSHAKEIAEKMKNCC